MAAPVSIESLVLKCRNDRSAFVAGHPYGFFLLEDQPLGATRGFATSHVSRAAVRLARELNKEQQASHGQLAGTTVVPIQKRPDSPWSGHFSVGRARNNDLVIAAQSISKLHALLTWEQNTGLRISDARSTNGVRVNGAPVAPGGTAPVAEDAVVQLGDVRLRYLSTARFLDMIAPLL